MVDVIIHWDKNIFDGENRLLPNRHVLYTQIYPDDKTSWSLKFSFEISPRNQGLKTIGEVDFLVAEAPREILVPNFEFDFLDGPRKIGVCKIIEKRKIDIAEIIVRISLIEEEKLELKNLVRDLRSKQFKCDENDINSIYKWINEYPFLFSLVLDLNEVLACKYLESYFINFPIEDYILINSNLAFFLFGLKEKMGIPEFNKYISQLDKNIANNDTFKKILADIL